MTIRPFGTASNGEPVERVTLAAEIAPTERDPTMGARQRGGKGIASTVAKNGDYSPFLLPSS